MRQLRFAPDAHMPYMCYGGGGYGDKKKKKKKIYFVNLTIDRVTFALAVIQAIMSSYRQPTVWMSSSTQIIAEAL